MPSGSGGCPYRRTSTLQKKSEIEQFRSDQPRHVSALELGEDVKQPTSNVNKYSVSRVLRTSKASGNGYKRSNMDHVYTSSKKTRRSSVCSSWSK